MRYFLKKTQSLFPLNPIHILTLDSDSGRFSEMPGVTITSFFKSSGSMDSSLSMEQFLSLFLKKLEDINSTNTRVFIPSINCLFVLFPLIQINETLNNIINSSDSLVVGVSKEVLSSQERMFLSRLSTTMIQVSLVGSVKDQVALDITHKKKHSRLGVKLERSKEVVRITQDSLELVVKKKETKESGAGDLKGLTFNLSLSEQEKEAKDQVTLPYLNKRTVGSGSGGVGGEIHYVPDEFDDVDEEDPDDDLGI